MTDIGQPSIVKATVLNPFNIQDFPADKQIKLDVRVEDEAKAVYSIEVQTESHPGFFDRILYYWSEIYGSQLQRGEGYVKLRPVRSIVIAEFPVFPELSKLHAVFDVRAKENPAVLLSQHLQIHVLRLGDYLRNVQSGLDQMTLNLQRWMQFWAFGLKEGEAKGEARGRVEGEARKAQETARTMKTKGLDNVLIAEITGLSLSEIERLD